MLKSEKASPDLLCSPCAKSKPCSEGGAKGEYISFLFNAYLSLIEVRLLGLINRLNKRVENYVLHDMNLWPYF